MASAVPSRRLRAVAAGVPLACVAAASFLALYQAWGEGRAIAALAMQDRMLAQGLPLLPQHAPSLPPQSARAILADILLRARAAQFMRDDDPRRVLLLGQAQAQLDRIEGAHPYWGEYWAVRAFVMAMLKGDRSSDTVGAFNRSYRETPYIYQSADWRVDYALRNWGSLSPDIRPHAIREMVWLARREFTDRDRLIPQIRETDAYRLFMIEWLAVRSRDADFSPVEGLPPQ